MPFCSDCQASKEFDVSPRNHTTQIENQREREGRIIELVESGDTIAAVRLARDVYGYDLTEAKMFVDGLMGRES